MNIDELTIGQARELTELFSAGMVKFDKTASGIKIPQQIDQDSHWQIGANYLIRTVTFINIGTLVKVTDKELVLLDASWIADTGRYTDALETGMLHEVEPYPAGKEVIIGRGALVDACTWDHPLPREQK